MKTDCAFYGAENKGCSALNETKCDKCRFYKTEREFREGQARAKARIRSLPRETQDYISAKYYEGKL